MTEDITWECDNCKCTHTCTHVEHLRDDYLYKEDDPIRPIACPYFYDGDNSTLKRVTWKRVKTDEVNPSIGTQSSEISEPVVDADVDALLEVIKQKDAIIDNCRSSLRESYDIWLKQSDLGVKSLFLIFVGGIVGWFARLVLF